MGRNREQGQEQGGLQPRHQGQQPEEVRNYLHGAVTDGILEDDFGQAQARRVNRRPFETLTLAEVGGERRKVGRENKRTGAICTSRSGYTRREHALDKDGRCVWCDCAGRGLEL